MSRSARAKKPPQRRSSPRTAEGSAARSKSRRRAVPASRTAVQKGDSARARDSMASRAGRRVMDRLPTVREPGAPEVPRQRAPASVPVISSEEELFPPSPYAGMSLQARRDLSELILQQALEEEHWGESAGEEDASGEAGDEGDEDWPMELHPLHGASHRP